MGTKTLTTKPKVNVFHSLTYRSASLCSCSASLCVLDQIRCRQKLLRWKKSANGKSQQVNLTVVRLNVPRRRSITGGAGGEMPGGAESVDQIDLTTGMERRAHDAHSRCTAAPTVDQQEVRVGASQSQCFHPVEPNGSRLITAVSLLSLAAPSLMKLIITPTKRQGRARKKKEEMYNCVHYLCNYFLSLNRLWMEKSAALLQLQPRCPMGDFHISSCWVSFHYMKILALV